MYYIRVVTSLGIQLYTFDKANRWLNQIKFYRYILSDFTAGFSTALGGHHV